MVDAEIPKQAVLFENKPVPGDENSVRRKAHKKTNSYESLNLGKAIRLQVPDFSDPDRPSVRLEVDLPIAPINVLSNLEGNAASPA